MAKATTALLVPVVLAGVAYGGAKAYIYFSVKGDVDKLVQQASLFADINYGGISSDLMKGSVSVDNIIISPKTIEDDVEIREIKVQGDGPGFLFSDTSKISQQTPENLTIAMNGLRIGLDGEMYRSMMTMQAQQAKSSKIEPAKPCYFGGALDPEDLRNLGYDEIFANAMFNVQYDKLEDKTKMEMSFELEDMGEMTASFAMRGGSSPMMMAATPGIEEIRFVYESNEDYLNGTKKYCAEKLNKSVEDYISYLANASDAEYQRYYGFIPGPGIRKAVGDFMRGEGNLDVRMRPSKDMKPMMLSQYRPSDIVRMLGTTVYVDGNPVGDLSFTIDESMASNFGDKSYGNDKKKRPERKKVTYTFQKTDISRLPQYIGAQVKVATSDGRQRQGTLISVDAKMANIEQRLHGGKFEVHVPLQDIRELEVHRLLKTADKSKN